jgi:hypothetical protein
MEVYGMNSRIVVYAVHRSETASLGSSLDRGRIQCKDRPALDLCPEIDNPCPFKHCRKTHPSSQSHTLHQPSESRI